MTPGITVVIPTISTRTKMLSRAVASVTAQDITDVPVRTLVVSDEYREGAAVTRHRGLLEVGTTWTAFLDDDDEFKPDHLRKLHAAAHEHDADMVYSWFDVVGGTDPFPQFFGQPWDPAAPHHTTVVTLVRTELALAVGGFLIQPEDHVVPGVLGEDWIFTLRMNAAGTIHHLPEKTWIWNHHGKNTSGLPDRW